ncbi:hypothetical protein ISX56_34105, partial [Serratia ureilytica]|nr:hypothetical protein [Serratia ureilytica]
CTVARFQPLGRHVVAERAALNDVAVVHQHRVGGLLFQLQLADAENPLLNNEILLQPQVAAFAGLLHPLLSQYAIRLTDEGEQYLIFYCAVVMAQSPFIELLGGFVFAAEIGEVALL